MNYNPYDLVPMSINGQDMQGRPFEFDSDVANQRDMTNAFGAYVKPTRLSTCCPDCGDGMEVSVHLPDPPFPPVIANCQKCFPDAPEVIDPFMNPIDSGRIAEYELDPLLHNPDENVVADDTTVAERMALEEKLLAQEEAEREAQEEADDAVSKEDETKVSGEEEKAEETAEKVKEDIEEETQAKPKSATKKKSTRKKSKKSAKTQEPEETVNPHVEPADGIVDGDEDIDTDEDDEGLRSLLEDMDDLEEDI